MSMSPLPPANLDLGTTLDERLEALNGVDKKVEEIMDGTRQIMENLIKDNKQISRSKMEESMRRFGKTLDEEISKVIQEQLNYMEQLCAGSEHQGSTFGIQNRRDNYERTLGSLNRELEALVAAKHEEEDEAPHSPEDHEMAEEARP